MSDLVLVAGDAVLRISPGSGGRMTSLLLDGLEVLGAGGPRLVDWGCYPMAPFAGRIRRGRLAWAGHTHQLAILAPPHAMHGVTIDRPWEVVESHGTSATLRCGFDGRWPWRGHAVQTVTLAPGGLDAVLEVHGDDAPMPAWSGWHPWFARTLGHGADVRIDLSAQGMLVRDDEGLPTGEVVAVPEGPWDDCFARVTWPVSLTWDGALRLDVSSDAPYAVVFDQRPTAVCVEPQTAPPDAAALGLAATVEPGAPLRLTMAWRWTLAPPSDLHRTE